MGSQRTAGTDLGGLLAQQLRPEAQFTVSLQGSGFRVDATSQHHVAIEAAHSLGFSLPIGWGEGKFRMLNSFAFGREELDEVRATVVLKMRTKLWRRHKYSCTYSVGDGAENV